MATLTKLGGSNAGSEITYVMTDDELDDLLRRRPGIALNRVHSDKDIAIARCKGATDRVFPASQVSEDLDEFICTTYQGYDILARKMTVEFIAPICVGDTVTFKVIDENQRGPILLAKIEVWKNQTTLVQTYDLTLVMLAK